MEGKDLTRVKLKTDDTGMLTITSPEKDVYYQLECNGLDVIRMKKIYR
jgi:uncharacterized protein (UPF0335 family)